jgi:amidase
MATVTTPADGMPDLLTATISKLSSALNSRRISSAALTEAYLKRIEEVNGYFCAVTETNPDAMSIAQALDEEQVRSGRRG